MPIGILGIAEMESSEENSLVRTTDMNAIGILENEKAGIWPLTFAKLSNPCSFKNIPEMHLELDAEPGDQMEQMWTVNPTFSPV